MIVLLLGLMDLAGSILTLMTIGKVQFGGINVFFAILLIIKALYSLLASIGSSDKAYLAAAEDMLAALFIVLATFGIYIHYAIAGIVGILLLIKGIQSILPEVIS